MTFGFSYIGCIFLLLLFVPNIIFMKHLPENYADFTAREDRILHLLERTGEVGITMLLPVTKNFNLRLTPWVAWLIAAFALMLSYELWWHRYFKGEPTYERLLSGFLGVPLAGAVLPSAALALLAVYGKSPQVALFVIPFAYAHIRIFMQHKKELSNNESEEK